MGNTTARTDLKLLEVRTVQVGFILVGLAIAVTGVSYILYSPFSIRLLVWIIGVAFVAVALLALAWAPTFGGSLGELPKGGLRQFLLLATPLAFALDSQICGLGIKACSAVCTVISLAVIGLAVATAIRLDRDQPIGLLLVPMVVLGLVPHCLCHASRRQTR